MERYPTKKYILYKVSPVNLAGDPAEHTLSHTQDVQAHYLGQLVVTLVVAEVKLHTSERAAARAARSSCWPATARRTGASRDSKQERRRCSPPARPCRLLLLQPGTSAFLSTMSSALPPTAAEEDSHQDCTPKPFWQWSPPQLTSSRLGQVARRPQAARPKPGVLPHLSQNGLSQNGYGGWWW